MQVKISVIVPIYNVEKYLPQCIESILCQTLKEIEIILVIDGSPDNSKEIACNYAKKDKRIKVINKKNGGLSDARNYGINNACGEYISFIDSDDWIDEKMLEDMYNAAILNDRAEVVVAGEIIEYVNEKYTVVENFDKSFTATNTAEKSQAVFIMCEKGLFNIVWNKIYKREFIEQNKFTFIIDAMPAEDVMFNVPIFVKLNSLVLLDSSYYHYMKRDLETYVTKYSPKIYNVFLKKFNHFQFLFSNLSLDEEKHISWLNNTYISGLSDCVINMYRKGSKLNFREKRKFLEEVVISDAYVKERLIDYTTKNLYQRIFKLLFSINNSLLMLITYDILFFLRNNFGKTYGQFRKKQRFS